MLGVLDVTPGSFPLEEAVSGETSCGAVPAWGRGNVVRVQLFLLPPLRQYVWISVVQRVLQPCSQLLGFSQWCLIHE